MAAALVCQGLGKRYGPRWALRGLDLALAPGEAVALLGGNGAGKTTLLRACATLLAPTEGTLRVGGVDASEDGAAARARLGFAGDVPRLYGDLTAEENLRFVARFFPGGAARVPGLLAAMGLADRAGSPARALSRGMQQRLSLARALVGEPAVLLLDEPLAPLDAPARARVLALLGEAAQRGTAILLSAQRLDARDAPPWLGRAVALRDGRLLFDARGAPEELAARWAKAQEVAA